MNRNRFIKRTISTGRVSNYCQLLLFITKTSSLKVRDIYYTMHSSVFVPFCLLIHLIALTCGYSPHPRPGFPNRFSIDPRRLPLSCLEQLQQEMETTTEAVTEASKIVEDQVEEVNTTLTATPRAIKLF